MTYLERLLIDLDSWPWSAIVRVAVGFGIPPAFRTLAAGSDSIPIALSIFITSLVALRVVPALLRRALPFSVEAQNAWRERRFIAKEYDSFQWQKLFWIGLGLLLYAVAVGPLLNGELVVALICLIGGGAGLWCWRRAGVVAT